MEIQSRQIQRKRNVRQLHVPIVGIEKYGAMWSVVSALMRLGKEYATTVQSMEYNAWFLGVNGEG